MCFLCTNNLQITYMESCWHLCDICNNRFSRIKISCVCLYYTYTKPHWLCVNFMFVFMIFMMLCFYVWWFYDEPSESACISCFYFDVIELPCTRSPDSPDGSVSDVICWTHLQEQDSSELGSLLPRLLSLVNPRAAHRREPQPAASSSPTTTVATQRVDKCSLLEPLSCFSRPGVNGTRGLRLSPLLHHFAPEPQRWPVAHTVQCASGSTDIYASRCCGCCNWKRSRSTVSRIFKFMAQITEKTNLNHVLTVSKWRPTAGLIAPIKKKKKKKLLHILVTRGSLK